MPPYVQCLVSFSVRGMLHARGSNRVTPIEKKSKCILLILSCARTPKTEMDERRTNQQMAFRLRENNADMEACFSKTLSEMFKNAEQLVDKGHPMVY